MNRLVPALLVLALWPVCAPAAGRPDHSPNPAAAEGKTSAVVTAANAFLQSLSAEQRAKVLFPFVAGPRGVAAPFKGGMNGTMTFVGERYGQAVWSNFPVSDVPRPGLRLGDLNAAQRGAAMALLRTALSPKGYETVQDIMGSDQALADGGTPFAAGVDVYTVGLFGTPSLTAPWMLQFGGHHLALNLVIAGSRGVLAPTLTGAQPAVYRRDGKTVRVLAQENDEAFDLLHALSAPQRRRAMLNYPVPDLVLGPGHDGQVTMLEGLPASAMTASQKTMLLDLIQAWTGLLDEAYVQRRMAEIKAGLDKTYFAWSGPTTHAPGMNGAAYYRIQGPTFVIEFAPQATNGDSTQHVHTIYRDLSNDYGRVFTARPAGGK